MQRLRSQLDMAEAWAAADGEEEAGGEGGGDFCKDFKGNHGKPKGNQSFLVFDGFLFFWMAF